MNQRICDICQQPVNDSKPWAHCDFNIVASHRTAKGEEDAEANNIDIDICHQCVKNADGTTIAAIRLNHGRLETIGAAR